MKYLLIVLLAYNSLSIANAEEEQSCRKEVGKKRAAVYVRQCIDISPATHPPCNDQNSCALIQDEIQRGCEMARTDGMDVPEYCADYLQ